MAFRARRASSSSGEGRRPASQRAAWASCGWRRILVYYPELGKPSRTELGNPIWNLRRRQKPDLFFRCLKKDSPKSDGFCADQGCQSGLGKICTTATSGPNCNHVIDRFPGSSGCKIRTLSSPFQPQGFEGTSRQGGGSLHRSPGLLAALAQGRHEERLPGIRGSRKASGPKGMTSGSCGEPERKKKAKNGSRWLKMGEPYLIASDLL